MTPGARTPVDVARDLAVDLRSNGASSLTSFVAGPVVVLDLDAGTLSTVCDAAAIAAANTWGQSFADPSRPHPSCRPGASFTCTQFSSQQMLIVELADPDAWRIVSVIVGSFRNGRHALHSKMSQMRSLIATASCP